MNYLSGLCTCDTTVTQAVNLIPLWWDSSQCQAQCGQSVPSDDTGHLHSDLWGDPMSQEQLLPSVASISPYKWPTKCWNPLFFPCNSKTSLPCKTAVKVYWVICSDRAHSLCSYLPQLCPSQGLKGMQGLIFQRCLSGMKERKQWLSTENPKQHSTNLNANQIIIHLKSHFIWKSYFCVCIMHVLKLNSQSTQLKIEGLFFKYCSLSNHILTSLTHWNLA